MDGAWNHCPIHGEGDVVAARALLRQFAQAAGFGIVEMTKLITAGSELARNILKYAGPAGGAMNVSRIQDGTREGIVAEFSDQGPGIADVSRAMQDGYSTSGSLGVGLPGAKRLVDDLTVTSVLGQGTTVRIVKWRR